MSDDKVRLLRWSGRFPDAPEFRVKHEEPTPEQRRLWGCDEWIARTVADDDAREERLKAAEAGWPAAEQARRDRDEWKARAERAEAEAAQLRARIDAEAGGGKDGPTNDRNHDAAAASGAAGTDPKEP